MRFSASRTRHEHELLQYEYNVISSDDMVGKKLLNGDIRRSVVGYRCGCRGRNTSEAVARRVTEATAGGSMARRQTSVALACHNFDVDAQRSADLVILSGDRSSRLAL